MRGTDQKLDLQPSLAAMYKRTCGLPAAIALALARGADALLPSERILRSADPPSYYAGNTAAVNHTLYPTGEQKRIQCRTVVGPPTPPLAGRWISAHAWRHLASVHHQKKATLRYNVISPIERSGGWLEGLAHGTYGSCVQ